MRLSPAPAASLRALLLCVSAAAPAFAAASPEETAAAKACGDAYRRRDFSAASAACADCLAAFPADKKCSFTAKILKTKLTPTTRALADPGNPLTAAPTKGPELPPPPTAKPADTDHPKVPLTPFETQHKGELAPETPKAGPPEPAPPPPATRTLSATVLTIPEARVAPAPPLQPRPTLDALPAAKPGPIGLLLIPVGCTPRRLPNREYKPCCPDGYAMVEDPKESPCCRIGYWYSAQAQGCWQKETDCDGPCTRVEQR